MLRLAFHAFFIIYIVALLVLARFGYFAPDPGKELVLIMGHSSAVGLLWVLSIPLIDRKLSFRLKKYSRLFGLWVFAMLCMHLLGYLAFFVGFDALLLLEDLSERPYVIVGVVAWLILLCLALTSNQRAMRLLRRGWKKLHKMIYVAVLLGLLHVYWLARSDLQWFLVYSTVFLVLIGLKVIKKA